MADLAERLALSLGSGFKVQRELGGGGMARVFLVRDETLGRDITVKVLPPELAEGVSAERFAREIRTIAQLQHPHIVPVLSAGALDGLPFYTMPYVSGQSARGLLSGGATIPLRRVVEILRDVAKALEWSHKHGVVHRDIKPDNILLTDNAAAVCDFGIAKAVSASRTPSRAPTLTGVGISIGTPAYMAPEQVLADTDADHRADLYSFGATAYELLTGHPPFAGRPAASLLRAQITEAPASLLAKRSDVPLALAQLVMRCLSKEPSGRPASAAEILSVLNDVTRPLARSRVTSPWAIGAVLIVVAVIVIGATMRQTRGNDALPSIAVLPFRNLSGDSASEYFSDGMTEQLVSDLGRANGLRVAPRALSFAQKKSALDPRSLAEQLRVDLLVTGSVRRSGDRLRVEAELMDPAAGERVWGATYDRQLDDVFLMQEEIARSIASSLKVTLAHERSESQTTDGESYDLYLRGKHLVQFGRRSALDSAVALFQQAVARDSTFAPAWAGLSEAYRQMAEHVTPLSVLPKAKDAARRAVQLDPTDMSAGLALANITLNFDWNWDAAEREYRRVLALHPDNPEPYQALSFFLSSSRRPDEALEVAASGFAAEKRREIDTLQARIRYLRRLAQINGVAGRREAAETALAELGRLAPNSMSTHHTRAWVSLNWNPAYAMSEIEIARATFRERLPFLSHLGVVYGFAGRRDTTRAIIRRILRRAQTEYVPKDQLFTLYLAAGDKASAYQWLHRAVEERHWWLPYLNGHPMTESVRFEPEYQRFLERIGVPAAAR